MTAFLIEHIPHIVVGAVFVGFIWKAIRMSVRVQPAASDVGERDQEETSS